MSNLDPALRDEMVAAAREFALAPPAYTFTERERRALEPFFSNTDCKIFFMSGLPEAVEASLLAMYSRLKNSRGLRGHFVDNMMPYLVAALHPELRSWKVEQVAEYLKDNNIRSLDDLATHRGDFSFQLSLERFMRHAPDPEFWVELAQSVRIQKFLSMNLDKFGHSSIARPTILRLCAEEVSIQFAKTVEWTWPGTGFIELSTRYVDFSGKTQLPVEPLLTLLDPTVARNAAECIEASISEYRRLIGEKFDGPFPTFLRERWAGIVPDESLKSGVIGESCDVLGNLLPCATLTQLGIGVSGEGMGSLIKNLYLDGTPENIALAEFIIDEATRTGHSYFLRHYTPTEWNTGTWDYLAPSSDFVFDPDEPQVAERRIARAFDEREMRYVLAKLGNLERDDHDQLPDQFRHAGVMVQNTMTYRGWRDLQRQSLSVHKRGRVTPLVGFYQYPKPAPPELARVFARIHSINKDLYTAMHTVGVPDELMEYPMAMGNLIPCQMTSTLKQAEFCNWQRTKWGVNDEVRQQFLTMERKLRECYPWWEQLSRADLTSHYVFARGKAPVVLPA